MCLARLKQTREKKVLSGPVKRPNWAPAPLGASEFSSMKWASPPLSPLISQRERPKYKSYKETSIQILTLEPVGHMTLRTLCPYPELLLTSSVEWRHRTDLPG